MNQSQKSVENPDAKLIASPIDSLSSISKIALLLTPPKQYIEARGLTKIISPLLIGNMKEFLPHTNV